MLMLQEASDEEKEKFLASMHMKVKSMAFRGDGYNYNESA